MTPKPPDILRIGRQFEITGELRSALPFTHGHINDTYVATYITNDRYTSYVHQRINQHVFKHPAGVMDNIQRVTSHIRRKLEGNQVDDVNRRVLTLVAARDGAYFHRTPEGDYWRTYQFIDAARIHDVVETPEQAYQAARAFGQFQQFLTDLPPPRLHETIPYFHDTPRRLQTLEAAIAADASHRAHDARREIEFVMARRDLCHTLLDLHATGEIPERITHNDTKFNNVMLDDKTREGICVLDLDTVMPGLALYDFGDMIRTTTSPTAEDELDLSKIHMQLPMFEALARGYLEAVGACLTPAEKQHLAFSGKLITLEIGIRFLTDHLEGDHYFKTHRPNHNLDRCRTQFKLVESIEQQEDAMNRVVAMLA